MTCPICIEEFNRSTHTPAKCPSCAEQICRACLQTWLLQDDGKEPSCMSCKAAWTHTWLCSVLTTTFRTGPYKQHREKVLYDRERARLPDTQEDAQRYKQAKELVIPLKAEIKRLQEQMHAIPDVAKHDAEVAKLAAEEKKNRAKPIELRRQWWLSAERVALYKRLEELRKKAKPHKIPFVRQQVVLQDTLNTPNFIVHNYGVLPRTYAEGAAPVREIRRAFIMKCPQDTCQGFLSQQYICGMCDIKVCAQCQLVKTDAEHMCDPELVETIQQIKKEARPCPKCASLISKIDGCDQMWCTQCNTAFSWNTGKIETQVIHNPHYFAYLRATGLEVPRAPGDIRGNPCMDTLHDTLYALRRTTNRALTNATEVKDKEMYTTMLNLLLQVDAYYRNALHLQQVTLQGLRQDLRTLNDEEPRRVLRVRRLTNEITDADWKFSLQKKEKATYKVQAWIQLVEMYAASRLETLGQLTPTSTQEALTSVLAQVETLREYVETEAAAIAKLYSCVWPRDLSYQSQTVV